MHILFAIIGVIAAISAWYWRLQMLGRAAKGGAELAKTASNLPRRLKFQHRAKIGGLSVIEDPREAAAVIMVEIARAGGEVSTGHTSVMRASMVEDFQLHTEDADALITQAAWLTREAPPSHAVVKRMSDILLRTPGIGPKQIVDLDGMLVAVSEADGIPNRDQLALLQVFRDTVGLKT